MAKTSLLKRIAENVDKDLETLDGLCGFVNIELPRELIHKLDIAADKAGYRTRSAYVRAILEVVANQNESIQFTIKINPPKQ